MFNAVFRIELQAFARTELTKYLFANSFWRSANWAKEGLQAAIMVNAGKK